ncbi:murein transglycosylase A [Actinobacillus ureae]|uniref:Membrane-bound lytic murein transglycosylase A n=1 Tax=Actinobacillus ureae ATCC 25976 TaxID=887324 RepID=E8KH08_9PAST|nr:murein transglycosylase A [Actinobacillus ureae]EFX91819.1 MltA specific insert domain protein [Actinobacillus ureae ATCC 25976]SUT86171.1 murein transglycosylase A [Actinobacillus ureae]SUU44980.1 murein transglycosylase A [Actinobacillus ureae]
MNWKAYKKWAKVIAIALLVASCSSDNANKGQRDYQAEHAKFGAVYKGRQYIPHNFVSTPRVAANGSIVNFQDFLKQLNNVRTYAGGITGRYAGTYGKVSSWIASGGKVSDLARYNIHALQMRGEDGFQNVLMTGYYSPVIHARRTPQGKYQHPIYAMPSQKRFTRSQIYDGALEGKGLELAYSDSMLDKFLLGVQGSGYVDFGDGRLNYFAYAGQNGFKYVSVGRLLVEDGEIPKEKMSIQAIREWGERNPHRVQGLLERNPSYVFFKNDPTGQVKGSAGVPLVALASVASDKSLVPSGSVLLVETPLIDRAGNWTGKHELRLMVALDVGGAVKGHHFDLYQGIGGEAGHKAGLMKHYGRVWVLN